MPQSLESLTPLTSFIPFATFLSLNLLPTSRITATIATRTNRWNLLIIGGTVIAVFVLGGSAAIFSEYPVSDPKSSLVKEDLPTSKPKPSPRTKQDRGSLSTSPSNMFQIASYLAEKVSSLIPWRSAATALKTTGNGRRTAIELEERAAGERACREEVERLKRLLEDAKAREEAGAKIQEEVGVLRDEVKRLKTELEGKRDAKGKQKTNDGESLVGEDSEPVDPYSEGQDKMAEEEVISLLGALNFEILDVAHTITRAFANGNRPPPPLPSDEIPEDLKEAIAGTLEILGPEVVERLQAPQRRGLCAEEEVVKMALRASMATYTHWIISSWYFENPEDEHLLSEIYARVRETEEQTVSGRWRALTRLHLQRMLAAEPDLTVYMVDAFVNIILTAGWHNDATALQDYLIQTFGEKIGVVLKRAKRLNKAIGEEIIKCDLEALYIAPDVVYNKMTMEVEGGNGRLGTVQPEERVLCTTELGLVKAEKKVGKVGEWKEAVLLKPSIVLQSGMAGDQ